MGTFERTSSGVYKDRSAGCILDIREALYYPFPVKDKVG